MLQNTDPDWFISPALLKSSDQVRYRFKLVTTNMYNEVVVSLCAVSEQIKISIRVSNGYLKSHVLQMIRINFGKIWFYWVAFALLMLKMQ